jgi:tetratricopeptide (TPR) repeat protein
MTWDEQNELGRKEEWLKGAAGILAFHDLLEITPEDKLASGYAQVGEMMRLFDTIEKQVQEIMDTTLEAVLADSSIQPKDSANAFADVVDALADEELTEQQLKDAAMIDSIFSRAATSSSLFRYYIGNIQGMLGKDPGFYYYSAAIADPSCQRFRIAYLEQEKNPKGIEGSVKRLEERVKKQKSDTSEICFISAGYIVLGKPDKAISELTKYLKKNPNRTAALSVRAHAYYEKKDYTNAAADASASVAADSTNFEGWYVLGLTAQATTDPKAKEYFRKAFDTSSRELLMHKQAADALKKM